MAADIGVVPAVCKPQVGPFKLTDYEKVYATDPNADIFELRGMDRGGVVVVVVVRPDQYVAKVLPMAATADLAEFFAPLVEGGPATIASTATAGTQAEHVAFISSGS